VAAHQRQGNIEAKRACGNRLNIGRDLVFAHFHDGALAKLLLDLGNGGGKCLGLFSAVFGLKIVHGVLSESESC
jgi:hypothetical protein